MRVRTIAAITLVAWTAAGCAVSGGASAVAVRSQNGVVTAEGWSGGFGCELGPEAGPPCAAGSETMQVETMQVEPIEIP